MIAWGVALARLPLPGEVPACRGYDWTPYDRWRCAGNVALFVQVALECTGVTAA